MHPLVFETFDRLCRDLAIDGDVIELGASPHHQTLLALPSLARAARRIGVGLDGAAEGQGYSIREGNCHDLSDLPDRAFQLVLSNAMLEHDKYFWLSLAEAKRILAPGGYLVLGVPAFSRMGEVPLRRFLSRLARMPWMGARWRAASVAADASSLTLGFHAFPGDYYRFSEQAMSEVLLEGLQPVSTHLAFSPPRVFGVGRKTLEPARPDG